MVWWRIEIGELLKKDLICCFKVLFLNKFRLTFEWEFTLLTTLFALIFKVPCQLFYDRLPYYNFLKVFGSLCFSCLRGFNKTKCSLSHLFLYVLGMLLSKEVVFFLIFLAKRFLLLIVSLFMRSLFLLPAYTLINIVHQLRLFILFFLLLCQIVLIFALTPKHLLLM